MWTREQLKTNAKKTLRTTYWFYVAAYLIYIGISMAGSIAVSGWMPLLPIAVSIFLSFPLSVGYSYFLLQGRNGKAPEFMHLFFAFSGEKYLNVVGSMAWMFLFELLWALIPVAGIIMAVIKGISYSMTPFILADNPNIGYQRALKLSIAMTDGQKGEIFLLWLSFIGWGLLATIVLCVGWLFLTPYLSATYAELYVKLRENALRKGLCTKAELNMNHPSLT